MFVVKGVIYDSLSTSYVCKLKNKERKKDQNRTEEFNTNKQKNEEHESSKEEKAKGSSDFNLSVS